jgi:hypothetical protein
MGSFDQSRIAEIRDRIAGASPGPWAPTRDENGDLVISTGRPDGRRLHIKRDLLPASVDDIAFIALARDALPRLLKALTSDDPDVPAEAELGVIAATASRASAGPWTPFLEEDGGIGGCSMIWAGDEPDAPDMYVWLEDEMAPSADIEFIAAAREDIPALLSEIRARGRRGGAHRGRGRGCDPGEHGEHQCQ